MNSPQRNRPARKWLPLGKGSGLFPLRSDRDPGVARSRLRGWLTPLFPAILMFVVVIGVGAQIGPSAAATDQTPTPRSPIALALSPDGTMVLTANQGNGTVSLVDLKADRVVTSLATGDRPAGIAWSRDGAFAVVTHWYGYDLAVLSVDQAKGTLAVIGRVEVGPEPRGVVLDSNGKTAFVAVGVANAIVRVALDDPKKPLVTGRIEVGREPRGVALSPDGRTLLSSNARSGDLTVVDVPQWKVQRTVDVQGFNLRQAVVTADGKWGYTVNMRNRNFPTTRSNIDIGWVLGQRITRIPLLAGNDADKSLYETLTIDPQGKAAADVHGIAITPDGNTVIVSSGGTHELMIFRQTPSELPWREKSSRDLMHATLVNNPAQFQRVPLGGRPTEVVITPDGTRAITVNYFLDSVQVVDVAKATLVKTVSLGGPSPEEWSLARKGEALFHNAERSFNQWYSCNTCHADGHMTGQNHDTMNDGWHDYSALHKLSQKKAPTLRRVMKTGPWTWHGWQKSFDNAMSESFLKSMQGFKLQPDELEAVKAFMDTLDYPKNPYRNPDGSLSPEAERGRMVFKSAKAACNTCHGGPEFTDGKVHEVGLEESRDVYQGYNPPSLVGIYDKAPFLHDGRSKTLKDVLTGPHNTETLTGQSLTEQELSDLLAYLKTL